MTPPERVGACFADRPQRTGEAGRSQRDVEFGAFGCGKLRTEHPEGLGKLISWIAKRPEAGLRTGAFVTRWSLKTE